MRLQDFPKAFQPLLIPEPHGHMLYTCLGCGGEFGIEQLLYTCPRCGEVLLLENRDTQHIQKVGGAAWRQVFDHRRMLNHPPLKGIFRYYEFIAPVIPLDRVVYLGEGHTPLVRGNGLMRDLVRGEVLFKNDGLNPSASFKDRGMACALSYLNFLATSKGLKGLLAVCASTGDTSASAALYASYLGDLVTSVVLLPQGKVTPQQLLQPLGSGAYVIEIPGVFDDCMKVVEVLSERYDVALLNSKNSWRILGQESFSYEIAQDFDYDLEAKAVVVPIGNAGNITAVMSGFLKFFQAGVIRHLPKIIGVQSEHADPVYRYYLEQDPQRRRFEPVTVRPSVAQAAMIGNPVSMPRVIRLARDYEEKAGERRIFVVQVTEQEIMDCMVLANRNGHIACTQGGECLAGLIRARQQGLVRPEEIAVLDSTAHALKFAVFQEMYFQDAFPPEFEVTPREELRNAPVLIRPEGLEAVPAPGRPLEGEPMRVFIDRVCEEIAQRLGLVPR